MARDASGRMTSAGAEDDGKASDLMIGLTGKKTQPPLSVQDVRASSAPPSEKCPAAASHAVQAGWKVPRPAAITARGVIRGAVSDGK